jgi:two-component SAPR family response regulator
MVITVRTNSPMTVCRWRQLRVQADEMATSFQRSEAATSDTLEVHALGPLVVHREGIPLTGWGGPKAGRRHALAIFAFLLDRGESGAHREEIVELIWPERTIGQADLAFHRTIGGLRRVIAAPDLTRLDQVITTRDGIYRLNTKLVHWSDVEQFEDHVSMIESADDLASMEAHLDAVRRLYRGDYMDDCPIYGDSSHVEARRQLLRSRYASALQSVAEARAQAGKVTAAAHLVGEALAVSGSSVPDYIPGPRVVHDAA